MNLGPPSSLYTQIRLLLITLSVFSSQICVVVLQICKTRLKILDDISEPLSDATHGIKKTYDGILGLGEIPPFLEVLCIVVCCNSEAVFEEESMSMTHH